MSDHQNQPREYDAVKGGQNLIPVNAAVLGSIAGQTFQFKVITVNNRGGIIKTKQRQAEYLIP